MRRRTPITIPVKLIAYGRDKAPAPSVALQRLDTDPGCKLSQRSRSRSHHFLVGRWCTKEDLRHLLSSMSLSSSVSDMGWDNILSRCLTFPAIVH